jgi:CrcB protein
VVFVLVALGGAVGAVLRWTLTETVPGGDGFPWTTFAINVVGSLLLALLPALPTARRRALLTAGLGPGLLGGFTTLSACSEQTRALLADGRTLTAALYLVGTLAAGVAAVALVTPLVTRLTTPAERLETRTEGGDR